VETSPSKSPSLTPVPEAPLPEEVIATSHATTAQLVESLLHDTRNPLNAMAINLEVLSEKLKDDSGTVPPPLEKNIKAMREQVFRVDAILRSFAEFLVWRPGQLAEMNLAQVLSCALEVLGHDVRKRRLKVKVDLAEEGLPARLSDPLTLRFLAYQSLHRAVLRSEPGQEIQVALRRDGERTVLKVQDAGGEGEPDPLLRPALEALGRARSVDVSISGGRCELRFAAGQ
jgi:signal transduction histidine kinase